MSAVQPNCYHACGRKAAHGRLFCSARCAAEWAEELARGNEDEWCVACQSWQSASVTADTQLGCGHVKSGIRAGMKHDEAKQLFERAIQAKVDGMATQFEEPAIGGHLCSSVGHGIDQDPLAKESRR